jgi:hypothetical protein
MVAGKRQGRRSGEQSIDCRPALDGDARVVERKSGVAWRQSSLV